MYVKLNNGVIQKFPYSTQDLRQENSNVSFPAVLSAEMLAGFGVFPVTENARPVTDRFSHTVKRSLPELVNGAWVVLWDVLPKSSDSLAEQDERQAENVRDSRDGKLSASDWTQVADAPLTSEQKTAWAAYRQALRDVPSQVGFPWETVWPAKP